jgi:hypothetical protein
MKIKSMVTVMTLALLAGLWGIWQVGEALAQQPLPDLSGDIPAGARCERDWLAPINDAAAGIFGITAAELVTQLHHGATLAELAGNEAQKVKLQKAIIDIQSGQIDEAVANGWIDETQAAQLKLVLPLTSANLVQNGGGPYWGQGFSGGRRWGMWRDDAAAYLELTPAAIADALYSGQSLGGLTEAQGKDVAGLVNLLLTEANTRLAQAVAEGKITQAQADRMTKFLEQNLAKIIYSTGPCSLNPEDLSLDEQPVRQRRAARR